MIYFVFGALLGVISTALIFRYLQKPTYPVPPDYVELIPADKVTITVQVFEDNHGFPAGKWFDLPLDWETIVRLARRIIKDEYSFGYALTGKEAGNPLTRAEYERLRSLFLEKNLIVEKVPGTPRSGLSFTAAGRAFLKQFASYPTKPDTTVGEWSSTHREQTHTNTI